MECFLTSFFFVWNRRYYYGFGSWKNCYLQTWSTRIWYATAPFSLSMTMTKQLILLWATWMNWFFYLNRFDSFRENEAQFLKEWEGAEKTLKWYSGTQIVIENEKLELPNTAYIDQILKIPFTYRTAEPTQHRWRGSSKMIIKSARTIISSMGKYTNMIWCMKFFFYRLRPDIFTPFWIFLHYSREADWIPR